MDTTEEQETEELPYSAKEQTSPMVERKLREENYILINRIRESYFLVSRKKLFKRCMRLCTNPKRKIPEHPRVRCVLSSTDTGPLLELSRREDILL